MKGLLNNLYSQLFVQAWHVQTEPLGENQLSAVSLEHCETELMVCAEALDIV